VGLNRYLFVPDYVGKSVFIQALTGGRQRYTFTIPDCNPNSIARSDADLIYVACNKDFGNGDHIEVYDLVELAGLRPRGYLEVPSKKTITSPEFNSIIDLKFDPDGNMWVSSYGNNQIIRFPKSSLDLSNPQHIEFWTAKLNTTPEQLKAAVELVGTAGWAVENHFEMADEEEE
jgi:hypothetical protein